MKQATLLSLMAFSLFGCKNLTNTNTTQPITTPPTDAPVCEIKTGGNQLIEVGGKYYVWTKKVGDGKIKVLLLHGGPGFSHKNWEFWDKLPDIKIPVLVLGGMLDEMNPESMKREGQLLPNSRTYLCPNGSHLSMYDDQQNYFNNLTAFLKEVDNDSFAADKK